MGGRCQDCGKTCDKVYECECIPCCRYRFMCIETCRDCMRCCPRCARWYNLLYCAPKETPTCKHDHNCKIAEFCKSCAKESVCRCCQVQSCDVVAPCQGAPDYCNELIHFCCERCRLKLSEQLQNRCKLCDLTCCDSHKLVCMKGTVIVCMVCAKDISRKYVKLDQ